VEEGARNGRFIEYKYNILKSHASWLTSIEVVEGHSQDVWRVQELDVDDVRLQFHRDLGSFPIEDQGPEQDRT
jgi:hypothetical protein